jgi:hypothetical protein
MKKEEIERIAEELGIEAGDPKKIKISWYHRLAMKFSPKLFLKWSAREMGLDEKKIDLAYKLFDDSSVHIEPLSGGARGFIVTLDNKLNLWFYQDGDHFKFDGIEMGEYGSGDVTVFDNLKKNN